MLLRSLVTARQACVTLLIVLDLEHTIAQVDTLADVDRLNPSDDVSQTPRLTERLDVGTPDVILLDDAVAVLATVSVGVSSDHGEHRGPRVQQGIGVASR